MSTSTTWRSDRSRRRFQEDGDEEHGERDSTPREFGHNTATYSDLEGLDERIAHCHLDISDSKDTGSCPRGSNSSDVRRSNSPSSWGNWNWATADPEGYWWRSKKDEEGQDIYEYDTKTSGPEAEMTASSPRFYTTARATDSTSSQVTWQSNHFQSTGSRQVEGDYLNVASTSYTSGSNISTQPTQMPPVFIPPPIICGCDSRDHLCGVIIFPPQHSPKDGKIGSKKVKSKPGSSSVSSSGASGSGSGKLSAKGPNGSGCGPIVAPGITPFPKPQPPPEDAARGDWKDYEQRIYNWEEGYKDWKHITCPCRRGYFDEDGKWVSGGDVRRGIKLSNPRWESTNGIAPDVRSDRNKYRARLFERSYSY